MNTKRINWTLWIGLVLSLVAFLSYPFVFVWFPVTRDFPWATLLLFAGALVLLILGLRRGFSKDRSRGSKIITSIVTTLGVLIFTFFIFTFFIAGRALPSSSDAPHVGQKAPDFTLSDTNKKQVSLADLLSSPVDGKAPKGVLLIFYRGYW
jgi:hypothetical protein